MKKLMILLAAAIAVAACAPKASWPCGWDVKPADCLDTEAMNEHFAAHPDRWEAAFEFLKTADLSALELGDHEILGRDVYASVSEYEPKDPENCRFEAHRKYVDLQYIISGEEMMGVTSLDKVEETVPYVEDIVFFGTEGADAVYETATPEKFFIFFPKDAHRPSMKSSEDVAVRKVVIKLLY